MTYQVKVTNSIGDIDEREWNDLNHGLPFGSLHWYRLAASVSNGLEPVYILLHDGKQLVGRAVASITNEPGVPLSSAIGRRVVSSVLNRYPLLICQSIIGSSSGFLLPKENETAALEAISEAIHDIAISRHASFSVLGWLTPAEKRLIQSARGYQCVPMDDSNLLVVTWSSFDEYVASLSKSMQKDMRRHNNRARELGITVERSHDFAQYSDKLRELVSNVERQHNSVGTNPYTDQVFSVVQRELADTSTMLLAYVEGTLAACGLVIHDEGVMSLILLGMDYQYKYVYFQLFYEALRHAIEHGIRVIRGGTGAYEFKQRLGFQSEPTYAAFHSHRPLLQWFGTRLASTIAREQVVTS